MYICVDGPTEHTDIDQHKLTLDVANDKNWKFKKTIPILRKDNYNCRTNIITTISELFQKHDRLIILEDDLIIGKYFLMENYTHYHDKRSVFPSEYCVLFHLFLYQKSEI